MDTALHKNQTELRIFVFSVAFQMLSDGHRFLNQMIQVFGQLRRQTFLLKDAEDLIAGDPTNLSHSVPVSQHYTDLWGSHTLLREFTDLVDDIISR